MLATVSKLQSAIDDGNFVSAEEIVQIIDVQLVLDQGQTLGIYSELLEALYRLPDPQCAIGQWIVNIFQRHWKHISTDDAYELLRLCEAQVNEVRHSGAHQAMAEALEDRNLTIVAGDA